MNPSEQRTSSLGDRFTMFSYSPQRQATRTPYAPSPPFSSCLSRHFPSCPDGIGQVPAACLPAQYGGPAASRRSGWQNMARARDSERQAVAAGSGREARTNEPPNAYPRSSPTALCCRQKAAGPGERRAPPSAASRPARTPRSRRQAEKECNVFIRCPTATQPQLEAVPSQSGDGVAQFQQM